MDKKDVALILVGLGVIVKQNHIIMKLTTKPAQDIRQDMDELAPNWAKFNEEVANWAERILTKE